MMMASKTKSFAALRKALIEKTGWSPFALSRRVNAVKKRLPMKTKVAQAVVAHEAGVRPDRFLDGAELDEVQQTIAKLAKAPTSAAASGNGRRPARAKKPATRVFSFGAFKLKTKDPFLGNEKYVEAVEMARAYPLLYVLENSIRTVIKGVMEAKYGADWWDTQLTSAKARELKNKVDARLRTEDQQSWHQRRGAHQIDYVDLPDLLIIARSKQDVFFPRVLGDEKWFESLISETSPSRNVLCHMNPLKDNTVNAVSVKLTQWHDHLNAREAEIRAAMTPAAAPAPPTSGSTAVLP